MLRALLMKIQICTSEPQDLHPWTTLREEHGIARPRWKKGRGNLEEVRAMTRG